MLRMIPLIIRIAKEMTWRDVRSFVRFMIRRLDQARLQQVAGNLTFVTLLSLVPLLTIALALFTQFPMFGTLHESLQAYFTQAMFPKQVSTTILGYLTRFASKAAHMSVVGAIGLFISAVAMVGMIEQMFNQIWRIRKPRTPAKRILLYCTVAIIGPFAFAVSLSLTMHLYIATGGTHKDPSFAYNLLFFLLSVVWSACGFSVLYVIIPNRTIHWREAIYGGLFAAITFEIAKRVFAFILVQFPTYRTIYGAVAVVPIFLLWIYLSWLITLTGAALVAAIHYIWHGRWRRERKTGGIFLDAVEVLRLLCHARENGVTGLDEAEMRSRTGFGLDEIEQLMSVMQTAGWVEMIKPDALSRIKERTIRADSTVHWRLVVDPAALTLASVFRLFVFDNLNESPLAAQVDAAIGQGLGESLSAHFARVDEQTLHNSASS